MKHTHRDRMDRIARFAFRAMGSITIVLLAAIFFMLARNSISFFREVGVVDFLTGTEWNPGEGNPGRYGILPLLSSTLLVTLGSMAIAIPLGIFTAAYLSEFAPRVILVWLKPLIEMLAAIPSVAIGFLGIIFIGPAIARTFHVPSGLNALNGSILLALMALPTIISVAEDAIHAVPYSYKEASYGLGADKWETLFKITLPAARPGMIAAVMLGMGRAIGETMTVLMASGNALAFPHGFLDPIRTITATIAIEMGEVPYQTTHYFSLFAIAAVLFLITLAVNLLGEYFANRYRRYQA